MRTVEIHKALAQHALYPIPHHVLLSLLKEYKRPNDKINELIKERALTPIKKGLYIAGPSLDAGEYGAGSGWGSVTNRSVAKMDGTE